MLKSYLPTFIRLPNGTILYPVIGGCLKQQPFTTATSRETTAAEAKRRKLKYRRVEVLSRNLRGKLDLHRKPYKPTSWIFVEVKEGSDVPEK